MKTYTYENSTAWFKRAVKVIPCGIYGHFSPAPCVPVDAYPFFSEQARGARFWDVDGNEFIDYMCAYGPMVLGYGHPAVDEAYLKQRAESDANSIASPRMVELAEMLVDMIPTADWAFFARNGADVTNMAVMVARSATGRKKIVTVKGGYHGTAPWMQAPGHHGVMEDDHQHVIRIPWNDLKALEAVIAEHGKDIAGLIATPYHHPVFADNELPAEGYWQQVTDMLHKNGSIVIVDDVRAGFRLHLGGSCERYGFRPDLIAFSKAIANGYALSALVGVDALRVNASKVFHTGSFWFCAGSFAAAMACLKELQRLDGPNLMRELGRKLTDGIVSCAASHGYTMKVSGELSMPYLRIANDDNMMLQQAWCGECTRRGAFFTSHHNWFLSTAHTEEDINRTLDICDEAFKAMKEGLGAQ
ncbi:MAG: aminotransferase class III-fold pyridoxal phosphate-dependent enzyme [Candidatus Hydrogenedentes bacterium]|nr:aminotransferase class III-fold pyridoxal phosphate-dependent enzyme [Candidatus Hydrogenedentota bacterium]